MKNKIFLLLASAILAPAALLPAQESMPARSHYYLCSLGYMFSKFPEPLHTRMSAASLAPGEIHIPVHADVLGVYYPRGARMLVGGVFEFALDRRSGYGNAIRVEQYQPSVSVLCFVDERIRTGLFVRADAGPALLRIASGDAGTEKSNIGWGCLVGTGYTLARKTVSFLVSVNYSSKSFRGDPYQFVSTGLGILF